jgi:hypothetical protein
VVRGSGGACISLAGTYNCSMTEKEKLEGTTNYRFIIQEAKNGAGQPTLNLGGENDFITDGDIHEYKVEDTTIKYSVDCTADTLKLHIVGSGGQELRSDFKKIDDRSFSLESSGTDGKTPESESRVCKK